MKSTITIGETVFECVYEVVKVKDENGNEIETEKLTLEKADGTTYPVTIKEDENGDDKYFVTIGEESFEFSSDDINETYTPNGQFEIKNDKSYTQYYVTIEQKEYLISKLNEGGELKVGEKITIAGDTYLCTEQNKKLVKIVTMRSVKIENNIYVKDGDSFYLVQNNKKGDFKGALSTNSNISADNSGYVSQSGFVTTNDGYICGIVVLANYNVPNGTGDTAGFVATNNGLVVYSSFNGQVYGNNANAGIASFVYANNGIIDYCHSTGAVQGEAKDAYSFGSNTSTGAISMRQMRMLKTNMCLEQLKV